MVELPDDALEVLRRRSSSRGYGEPGVTHEEWARSVLAEVYPVIAARVRAEAVAAERQRAAGMVQQFFKDHRGVDWGDVIELTRRILATGSVPVATPPRPEIVVLCGSTRFKDAFHEAAKANALAGRIVLTVSDLDPRPEMRHVNVPIDAETKARLGELHKRKIDLADQVLVLNVGGYIGESTRSEIEYATAHRKPISYLEAGPRLQPGRVGFGTDAFEAGGSLPGQPVVTPTEPKPGSDEAYRLQARLQAENRLVATLHGRSDPCRCPDCAASPVPAEQPPTCEHGRTTKHVYGSPDESDYGLCPGPAGQPEER